MRYGDEDEAIHDGKAWRWIGTMIIGTYLIIAAIIITYTLFSWYGLTGLFMAAKGIGIVVLIIWLILTIRRW